MNKLNLRFNPDTPRNVYQRMIAKEQENHRERIAEITRKHQEFQKTCEHETSDYHPDPSGNNDSYHECLWCSAQF